MASDPEGEQPTVVAERSSPDTAVVSRSGALSTQAQRVLEARAQAEAAPEPDQIGRFRILRRIGTGGMGVVYAAHDDELDRDVAIKLLRANLAADLSGRERLMREAQAIARLSHPNIVHVYEVGDDGARVYMAMELVRGQTLREYCKGKTWQAIVEVFIGAGEGLAAAHAEAVIHRDFKPDNVLVDERGRARVVDFGLARSTTDTAELDGPPTDDVGMSVPTPTTGRRPLSADLTGAGTVLGTPAYMAPEQLARADPDARTDQFAFCVSLYEMLYDRRPFKGSTYTELAHAVLTGLEVDIDAGVRGVPRAVRSVITRGLSRSPEARFSAMPALLETLRRAAAPRSRRTIAYTVAAVSTAAALVALLRPPEPRPIAPSPAEDASPSVVDPWAQIVADSDLPPTVPTPLPGDPTGVSVHRLRNGLTVYVVPRPLEPTVSVTVAVRAGSERERAWGPGLAFMVMNSVYRGTARLGVRDAALERPALVMQHRLLEALPTVTDPAAREALLVGVSAAEHAADPQVVPFDITDGAKALGGSLSGARTGSGTTYVLELPAPRVEGGMALHAEAVQRPVFRGALGIVRDQLDLYVSLTPNDLAWQVLQREIAAATGLHEDFEAASHYMRDVPLAAARALHDTCYRPNNAAVVMVGDITTERALALAEAHFGGWAPQPLPRAEPLDRPLPGGVVRREIEDGGAPAVFVSWALPPTGSAEYPAFVALADALARHDGLGSGLRERTAGALWSRTPYRTLDVRATALPDQSLAAVEAEIDAALAAIADDTIDPSAWPPALARAELARLDWARDPRNLAAVVSESFVDGRPWPDVARELAAVPTRQELVAAARALRERPRAVVHRRPGKTWVLPVLALPGTRVPERYGGRSDFARRIIDAPVPPPEPQFLVAGSHYTVHPRGDARIITTARPGPLATAAWVYPHGVDEDPFVCEAIRARVRTVRIAGLDFDAYCTNDFVWVDIVGPTDRFAREAPLVFDWLDRGMPSDTELRAHVDRALHSRAARRDGATSRNSAFHDWALRGPLGIQQHMPSDAALRKEGADALRAALQRIDARTADVLYSGEDPERIVALVPAAHGGASAPRTAGHARVTSRDTIYLLHDADRDDVEVRVSLPWPDLDPRTELAAQIHAEAIADGAGDGPPSLATRWVDTPWWASIHPLAFHVGYSAAPGDAALAVRTGIALVRRELPAAALEAARQGLEADFRAHRTQPRRIPEVVRLWDAPTDPRVAQWLALPSLEHADMRRLYDRVAEVGVVVSIVADLATIDVDALAAHGTIVRVDRDDLREILRDGPPS